MSTYHQVDKHQIDDFAHVDAGIQHVDTDGDARHVVVGKLIQQATFAVDARIVRHQDFSQFAVILRIEFIEDFFDAASVGFG